MWAAAICVVYVSCHAVMSMDTYKPEIRHEPLEVFSLLIFLNLRGALCFNRDCHALKVCDLSFLRFGSHSFGQYLVHCVFLTWE